MKYYEARNAGRQIGGVYFNITSLAAGTAWGVYATDDPEQIAALDALVQEKRSGVVSIDKASYEDQIAKKKGASTSSDFASSKQQHEISQTSLKPTARPAVVVQGGPEAEDESQVEIKTTLDSVEEATQTKEVSPPPTPQVEPEIKAKKKGRG
jgi:hypothetical protein